MQKRGFLTFLACLALAGCHGQETPKPRYPFPISGKITVVNFGAPDIAYSPEQTHTMQELQDEYGDRIEVMDVNIHNFPGVVEEFRMNNLPFQLFYDKEGTLVWGHGGPVDVVMMSEFVDRLLEGPTPQRKLRQ